MTTRPWMLARILVLFLLLPGSISFAQKPPAPYPGRPAPEAIFEDLLQAPKGSPLDIAVLRGRVVVLEFWATWCLPCIKAIPHMNQLGEQFQRDVIFIAVTDEPRNIVEPKLVNLKMNSWVAFDTDRSAFEKYGVRGLPHTVVIDAQGVVAGVTTPAHLDFDKLAKVVRGERAGIGGASTDPITPGAFAWETTFDPRAARAEIQPSATNEPTRFEEFKNRMTGTATPVMTYAMWAWDARRSRILVEGFDRPWEDLFDIAIVAPPGVSAKSVTQLLLQQQLGLSIDWEDREADALVLRRIENQPHQLVETPRAIGSEMNEDTSANHFDLQNAKQYFWNRRTVHSDRIETLRQYIETYAWLPVIDETGLDGFYSWSLELAMTDTQDKAPIVERELGLRLTREKRSVPMLVIKPRNDE